MLYSYFVCVCLRGFVLFCFILFSNEIFCTGDHQKSVRILDLRHVEKYTVYLLLHIDELTHDVSAPPVGIVYLPGSVQARAFKIPSLHLIAQ